ncbi:lasso peptide biosynthesis B2 protein [Roseateles sp.]|jgi:hypothetical protein|uniref:lasso peptide biosynthesis B2 protein n=1 Tax=Roseateles sp. TaxID=1971397 RepID=UPI0037CAFE4A
MQVPIPGPHLRLAAHVRACQVKEQDDGQSTGQVILLDLRQNRYLGIDGMTAQTLAEHIEDWPARVEPAVIHSGSSAVAALTRSLMERGLVTETSSNSQSNALIHAQCEEATSSLEPSTALRQEALTARRIGNFLASAALTAWWLRRRSLHWIALTVAARQEQLRGPLSDSLDAISTITVAYESLRPFAFSTRERCLHDSLALVSFLATEGLRSHWVIGVRTSPFGAHSWVQSGHMVLNDSHEHVRQFRPILVV